MTQLATKRAPFRPRPFPYVLMYHSVAAYSDDPYLVTVAPERFERQLRWLRDRGLRGVSMRELAAASAAGRARGLVGLTFDDGYADFAENALPALLRHGCTATVFVIAGRVGGTNEWDPEGPRKPLMTAEQVREVHRAGMEIGSHGVHHRRLSVLPEPDLRVEVLGSRELLAEITGGDVGGFCYPYGDVSGPVVAEVRRRYDYGCAIWRCGLSGRHALPRTYVGDRDEPLRLLAKQLRHGAGFLRVR